MIYFPTDEEFEQLESKPHSNIMKWGDLLTHDIYRVESIEEMVETNYQGKLFDMSYVVDLVTREGLEYRAQTTEIIADKILEYNLDESFVFIKPLGLKKSKTSRLK